MGPQWVDRSGGRGWWDWGGLTDLWGMLVDLLDGVVHPGKGGQGLG